MIKTIFSLSILALSLQAFSQNSLKIKGKIIEETSGHPLPFATIGISGSPYGTVSNPDGEFVFFLPPNYKLALHSAELAEINIALRLG